MFSLPKLNYDLNSLEPFIDEETMYVHYEGHHATYVKNLNDVLVGRDEFLQMNIEQLLKSLDKIPQDIKTKVKNNAGGHFHHLFLWQIMGPKTKGEPEGKLLELIDKRFGNFNSFKEKFAESALSLFGSGWTWLLLDKDKLTIENTPNQDSPISLGKKPIFTIDLWEHAYYLKYKNKRVDYINAFWNVVNWKEVENKLNKCL